MFTSVSRRRRGCGPSLALCGTLILIGCGSDGNHNPGPPARGTGRIEGEINIAGERPPGPVLVSYEGQSLARQSRLTNSEGLFLFHAAEAGDGYLWIVPPADFRLDPTQTNPVPVHVPRDGEARVVIRLTGDPGDVDTSNVGFADFEASDGTFPAAGIFVQAHGSPIPEVVPGATTNESGHAWLALAPGPYSFTAVAPSWFEVTDITPLNSTIVLAETRPVYVRVRAVGTLPDGSLEVFVANPDSVPDPNPVPAGIPITVTRTDGPGTVVTGATDESGEAHFDLGTGIYDVMISIPGGWDLWPEYVNPASVRILSATSTWARFYMSPAPESPSP